MLLPLSYIIQINVFLSREQAPISSRLNAIDLYLVVCIFLVFSQLLWFQLIAGSKISHLGALMEYAVILFLLKARRKPKRTIDEERLYYSGVLIIQKSISRTSRIFLMERIPTMEMCRSLSEVSHRRELQVSIEVRPAWGSRRWWRTSMPGPCGLLHLSSYSGISATGSHTDPGPTD